jgi:hypothetical protein
MNIFTNPHSLPTTPPVAKTAGATLLPAPAGQSRSFITTEDGTVLLFDSEIGTVSGRSEFEALREVERRKAMKRERRQA